MKKMICFISLVLFGEILSAAALPEPVLDYDFTAPVIVQRGKYKQQPKFVTAPEIATPVQALKLTKNNYITVPQSADMTIKNGMTFHAVVNFLIDKEIKNKTNTLDMIFFKPGEFLFGRQGKLIYFNAGNGQVYKTQWQMTTFAPGVPAGQWVALTATVGESKPGTYTVNMYINGKKVKTASFKAKINPANKELVTIGKGWGGWWIMEGLVATAQIYDKVLSPEQVAEIAKQIGKVAGK